jgi:hypothetical protein
MSVSDALWFLAVAGPDAAAPAFVFAAELSPAERTGVGLVLLVGLIVAAASLTGFVLWLGDLRRRRKARRAVAPVLRGRSSTRARRFRKETPK